MSLLVLSRSPDVVEIKAEVDTKGLVVETRVILYFTSLAKEYSFMAIWPPLPQPAGFFVLHGIYVIHD